ncbi:MAG: DNA repair protein RecO [Acidobacteria bacterium]|nr:DNA repair protein RecO [Acidobacteriota bacterium]
MAEFDDDAVVLDTTPYQDRHQIVAVLTAGHGLVRGVLRGARGGKAPAAAATQVLSLVRASWWLKASAELASFRRIELLRSSFPLSSDFEASVAGAAIAELFLSFCSPGEPHPRHFRLAGSATKALLDGKDPAALLAYVETWILRLGGVLPELGACSECGAALEDDLHLDPAGFLPLCPACAPDGAPRLDPDSARFLRTVLRTPPDALRGPPPPGAVRWLDRRIRDEAHRPLRALDFFRRHAATP